MPSSVLVTGVGRFLGSRLAAQLAADPSIDRVIGVDTAVPSRAELDRLGRTEFVRADIRNPLIARVIAQAEVDTVVHSAVSAMSSRVGGRAPMKEMNVIGTMQLLAACQKSTSVRRMVVKSSTAVYGASHRDPAVYTEEMSARGLPRSGYAKDSIEVEEYVRGFSRRRPDIAVTVLRFANFVGPVIETPVTRFLAMPVVPTALGFDPRLQFVQEDDAVEVLRLATLSDKPGVFNVAGDGAVLLSQAIRRAGRLQLPVPGPAVTFVGNLVRRSGMVDLSPAELQLSNFGRVVDTTRLRTQFPFRPRYTTAQALDTMLAGLRTPVLLGRRPALAAG